MRPHFRFRATVSKLPHGSLAATAQSGRFVFPLESRKISVEVPSPIAILHACSVNEGSADVYQCVAEIIQLIFKSSLWVRRKKIAGEIHGDGPRINVH